MSATLRDLPAIDDILRWPELAELLEAKGHDQVTAWAREAVSVCREELIHGRVFRLEEVRQQIQQHLMEHYQRDHASVMQPVINATGVLLHTNVGRAPLAEAALQRVQACTQYTNLEMDLQSGKRNHRGERVCRLLAQLTAAEDALVVNNCAAATMLVLGAIAFGKEVVVSRGQLVEIGGGFRLPEVFAAAGVALREVGTTNRTYLADYQRALGEETGAVIRVSRSNFSMSGFTTEPTIAELCCLERASYVPVIDDMGSGCVVDLTGLGIQEPTVQQSIQAGSDLCLFSGDKLFGGPQAGIILGRKPWIAKLRQHPMMRAMRLDKLTLAALEATTEIHLQGKAFQEIPFYQMLSLDQEVLRTRCQTVVQALQNAPKMQAAGLAGQLSLSAEVVTCEAQVGGGSLPGNSIPSYAVSIACDSVPRLAECLRLGRPAVLCRQSDDRLMLDLRTVPVDQLELLPELLAKAVAS